MGRLVGWSISCSASYRKWITVNWPAWDKEAFLFCVDRIQIILDKFPRSKYDSFHLIIRSDQQGGAMSRDFRPLLSLLVHFRAEPSACALLSFGPVFKLCGGEDD